MFPRLIISTIVLLLALIVSLQVSGEADDDPLSDPGHFDIFIALSEPSPVQRRFVADPDGSFPIDAASGHTLVPSEFDIIDFLGPPIASHRTDDPGWVIEAGNLLSGETLRFRALDRLEFFNPDADAWAASVPNGEQVRLFGAVPPEVLFSDDIELVRFYQQGTIWTTTGIQGPTDSAIEVAGTGGSIHSHLDFCVEDADGDCTVSGLGETGNPALGAYAIKLLLYSDATEAGAPKYADSEPLFVVINNGMEVSAFQQAVQKRIAPEPTPAPESPPPERASGVLILSTGS